MISKRMNIIICTKQGEFLVEVDLTETVLELKKKLEVTLGVPVSQQALSVYDFELVDELEMEFYQIHEGSEIDLKITPNQPNSMHIYLRMGTKQVCLLVNGTEMVADLKEEISRCSGVASSKVTLFFSGIEMDNQSCLRDYGVYDKSEVTAVLKPVGRPKQRPQAAVRRLNVVVKTASSLNSMEIPVSITDISTVSDVRKHLLENNLLPVDDYFFIHKQRILNEGRSLSEHGVRNGDHLHVFKGSVIRGD